ncbi:hypothetical protein V6N12_051823 [Hibiscus sabdariffa]|uniref:Ionotropic glutamate receptor C-terminal domain-containing protein n=1 Tax=Hibiscus sabdariffa TaxID=183260 RepID=A0ABR2GGG0_9ROSI
MPKHVWFSFFLFIFFSSFFHIKSETGCTSGLNVESTKSVYDIGVGGGVDSEMGAMLNICMSMALSDFYAEHPNHATRLSQQTWDSLGAVGAAASAVGSSAEASIAIKIADSSSPSCSPFLITTSMADFSRLAEATAATLEMFEWNQVVLVYQDMEFSNAIIPYLSHALDNKGIQLSHKAAIPTSAKSSQILQELQVLMTLQSKKQNKEKAARLNLFGLRVYDIVCGLATTVEKRDGRSWLMGMFNTSFRGISGDFEFVNGQIQPSVFEIFKITKQGQRTTGYWTHDLGISKNLYLKSRNTEYIRRTLEGNEPIGRKWIIGVPSKAGFKEFVNIQPGDKKGDGYEPGFTIEVFKTVWENLGLPPNGYDFKTMDVTYDELCCEVKAKKIDAAIGDMSIVASRSSCVDFTLPYLESGVAMLIKVRHDSSKDMWIFLKPLSLDLWLVIIFLGIFIGIVVRVLEHRENIEFNGSPGNQLSRILMFPCLSVAIPQRDMVATNCSRLVLVYTTGYMMVGPTYRTDGLGFALPIGSPLVANFSRAILNFTQGKYMAPIEKKYFGIVSIDLDDTGTISSASPSLTARSFAGLFIIITIIVFLALLSSENHVLGRLIRRYIFRISRDNRGSRVQPTAEMTVATVTNPPEINNAEENQNSSLHHRDESADEATLEVHSPS